MTPERPRLLVIDPTPIGSLCATGQFKRMLFRDWPRDRLLQLTTDFNGDDSVVLMAGDGEIRRDPSDEGRLAAIAAFAPDVIYVRPEPLSVQHFDTLLRCLGDLPQPAALHIMDDWVSGDFLPTPRGSEALERIARRIARRAALRFTDGPAYIADFAARLDAEFVNLLNGVDLDAWEGPAPQRPAGAPFTLTHMGNYDPEMSRQAIREIAAAVERLGEAMDIRFDVHVRDYVVADARADLAAFGRTRVLEQASDFSAYVDTLRRSDVNVYAYNQDAISVRYMGKGIPNKTCELLAAGKPILAFGPPAFAGIQYLRDHQAASIVSDPSGLAAAIRDLRDSPEAAARAVAGATRLIHDNHDAAKLRARFADLVGALVDTSATAAVDAAREAQADWLGVVRPQIVSHRLNRRHAPHIYAVNTEARALHLRLVDLSVKLAALNSAVAGLGAVGDARSP